MHGALHACFFLVYFYALFEWMDGGWVEWAVYETDSALHQQKLVQLYQNRGIDFSFHPHWYIAMHW